MTKLRNAVGGLGVMLALTCLATPSLADCASYAARIDGALASGDHAALKLAYKQTADCDNAKYRDQMGHHIAQRLLNLAGDSPAEAALNEVLSYGAEWQALAMLGDLAQSRGEYPTAAKNYQEALLEIAALPDTQPKLPDDVIPGLKHKAEEAGLLSATYVATPRGRGAENEGLAAASIRGVKVEKVALPVQFVFGKSEFTAEGLKAAEDMASFLKNDKPPVTSIRIVGHTDRIGSAEANMALSIARANALAQYLRQNGVTAGIVAEGVGSTQQYQAADRNELTPEQADQLDRRVELIRK